MNRMIGLLTQGQSCWMDDLTRRMIRSGDLARRVGEEGLRGITSNPAFFEKAVAEGTDCDEDIARAAAAGRSPVGIYEELITTDVRHACQNSPWSHSACTHRLFERRVEFDQAVLEDGKSRRRFALGGRLWAASFLAKRSSDETLGTTAIFPSSSSKRQREHRVSLVQRRAAAAPRGGGQDCRRLSRSCR
jgi:Transaldolase/Fructose-6-phosphate aldolase